MTHTVHHLKTRRGSLRLIHRPSTMPFVVVMDMLKEHASFQPFEKLADAKECFVALAKRLAFAEGLDALTAQEAVTHGPFIIIDGSLNT